MGRWLGFRLRGLDWSGLGWPGVADAAGVLSGLWFGAVEVDVAYGEAVGGKSFDDAMGLDQADGKETEESGVEQHGDHKGRGINTGLFGFAEEGHDAGVRHASIRFLSDCWQDIAVLLEARRSGKRIAASRGAYGICLKIPILRLFSSGIPG